MEVLLGVFVACIIAVALLKTMEYSIDYVGNNLISLYQKLLLSFYKLSPYELSILTKYFEFYNSISHADKSTFEQKVARFIRVKSFVVRGGLLEVSDEQKILIAACGVQITFGFPDVFLRHYRTIILYPEVCLLTIIGKPQQSEFNFHGVIILSWTNFIRDYDGFNKRKNLGLHEMALALICENKIANEEFDYLSIQSLHRLSMLMKDFNTNLIHQLFGIYALKNVHEFFAVSVKIFFERPEILRTISVHLYREMVTILRQDPLGNSLKY
jgi:hypothetical protein